MPTYDQLGTTNGTFSLRHQPSTSHAALGTAATTHDVNWNNQRVTSTNIFSSYSPQLYSNIQFNFTQPLLRNFSMDAIRQQVATSKKVRDLSDINLQTVVTGHACATCGKIAIAQDLSPRSAT